MDHYDNWKRKRSWIRDGEPSQVFVKRGLRPNKVMLCVWWDWKGIVRHELLPVGQTIDSQVYCGQLERLRNAIERKQPELNNRKGVVFHHDNAFPIIEFLISENEANQESIAQSFGVTQSQISIWLKKRKSILEDAASSHRRLLLKGKLLTKYFKLYKSLFKEFLQARSKGTLFIFPGFGVKLESYNWKLIRKWK